MIEMLLMVIMGEKKSDYQTPVDKYIVLQAFFFLTDILFSLLNEKLSKMSTQVRSLLLILFDHENLTELDVYCILPVKRK